MRCSDIMNIINEVAPAQCACDWDHVGLLLGRPDKSVQKILVTLDVTEEVADYAAEQQVDMIVSHHPLLFTPVDRITSETPTGRIIMKLLRQDISYFAAHTNYDSAPKGMAEKFLERLELESVAPITDRKDVTFSDGITYATGNGRFSRPIDGVRLSDLCARIKAKFGIKHLEIYKANGTADDPLLRKIAVCPGSGKSMIGECLAWGANVFITADVPYHDGLDAASKGMTIINAGHYGTEAIFMEDMEKLLEKRVSSEVEVLSMPVKFPYMFL